MLAQAGVILGSSGPGAGGCSASKAGISLINHRSPLHRSGGSRTVAQTSGLIQRAPGSTLYIAHVTSGFKEIQRNLSPVKYFNSP
jgi:hypothetical protein